MSPLLLLAPLVLASHARAESFQAWAARATRAERRKDYRAALESYSNALTVWKPGDGAKAKARILCSRAGLRERG